MAPSFDKLGRLIGETVDVSVGAATEIETRRRILKAAHGGERRWRAVGTGLAGAALAAAVAAGFVIVRRTPAEPTAVAFHVGKDRAEGRIGAYYSAEPNQKLALRFSDDSLITLQPNSSARVAHTTPTGAQVSLENGVAEVHVVHRPDTSWLVAAGPYSVHVTGTSFRVAWKPETRTIDVAMHRGAVHVTGPGLASGVFVRGTEHFTTRDRTTPTVRTRSPDAVEAPAVPKPVGPGTNSDRTSPDRARPSDASPRVGSPPPSARSAAEANAPARWSALAAKGRYADIVHAAERRGLDSVLAAGDRSALTSLADAARFTGRRDLARRTLLAVRERFAGSQAAADAAFVLGRMDDEAGAVSSGFAWYDRYLAEAPNGHFAAEALGRKMLALRTLGDSAASTHVAQEYLRRFPNGPYASVARQITTP